MARRRLDAWKEIATYLGRDVTTVRRWERRENLPVHRHLHDKLGSVYAYADEIDEWMSRRSTHEAPARNSAAAPTLPDAAPEAAVPAPSSAFPSPRVHFDDARRDATPAPEEQSPVIAMPRAVRSRAPWRVMLGIGVVLAVAMSLPWSPDAGEDALLPDAHDDDMFRVALTPPAGTVVDTLALSPDAQQVLFCGADAGGTRIWVRRVDSIVAEPLSGTDGASFPFWSADGQRFGFFAEGRLKVFNLATREVRDLAAAPEGHGGAWNERDEIVFAPGRTSALQLIRASGGELTQVTTIGSSFKEGHAWPSFLPDGRHFLYTDYAADRNRYGIYVGDLDTHESKRILKQYSSAAYGAGGFLLYVKENLMAQRFDPVRMEVRGEAMLLADQVLQRYDVGHQADFSIARTGIIAVRSAPRDQNELRWIDRATRRSLGSTGAPGFYSNPTLSPNGRQLIATVDGANGAANLWSFDLSTGQPTRISFGPVADFAPLVSPGGAELLFATPRGLFRQPFGGGNPVPTLTAPMQQTTDSWSVDGRFVTVSAISRQTKSDVWLWQLGDQPRVTPLINGPANEGQSRISPDGRYVAYVSDESGRFEVYVQAFPVANGRWQVSAGGGADPQWSRDRRELFYVAADRRMMAVPVGTGSTFHAGRETEIFKTQLDSLWMDTRNHYDVSADGRRFVVITPATERREAPFTLLSNWSRSLRR